MSILANDIPLTSEEFDRIAQFVYQTCGITLNQTGRELECMLLMMLIYLILSLIISSLMNAFNAAVKLKER